MPEGAWPVVLEVAALGIERQGAPEGILALSQNNRSVGDVLEEVKRAVPSLSLHRVGSVDRVWYIAHDLLGRLLLNIVFYNRDALGRFNLTDAQDPIHLRVLLLRRIAARPVLGRKAYQPLALEFPVNIFKLDNGRLEFARYWREVLAALDDMPQVFRNTSRAYKHHAAITRRRICTIREYFELTDEQRRDLLEQAIQLLNEGLNLPASGLDEETNLNMYNSLSLAYQDLFEVEQNLGAEQSRLTSLWKKGTEAAQQAQLLNPRNSYVLETLARNLIQTAEMHPDEGAEQAAKALVYVHEASLVPPKTGENLSGTLSALECLEGRTLPDITLSSITWTPIGPAPAATGSFFFSGRIDVAAPDPSDPNVMYVGANNGGVWKTTNFQSSSPDWTPLTDLPQVLSLAVHEHDLVVFPGNPSIILVAASGPGGGILRSGDGGNNWSFLANHPI